MLDLIPKRPTSPVTDAAKSDGNPRNSEGSFLRLRDGRIAFAYSRYRGNSSDDHAYAEIAVLFSRDEGETFGDERILVRPRLAEEYDETNCMSVSLLRLGNGDVGLFYLLKRHNLVSEVLLRRSSDEMETFSEPVRCTADMPAYYVVNNDRIIASSSGRLLVPVAVHPSSLGFYGPNRSYDGRARAAFFASDDDGATWRRLSDIIALTGGAHSHTGLQEPGVIELAPGVLYAYFRTDLGRHYESVSLDGGAAWFPTQPSQFTGPASPLHIRRNEYNGKLYAVWNPVPEYNGRPKPRIWTGGRTPLVIAEGEFDGNGLHWGDAKVIEDDPQAGFCYPAMLFLNEREALLAYCAGGVGAEDVSCLVRTRIRKITL
ncbi:MAG: sialidase family protein [Eubacteriales bacterium]